MSYIARFLCMKFATWIFSSFLPCIPCIEWISSSPTSDNLSTWHDIYHLFIQRHFSVRSELHAPATSITYCSTNENGEKNHFLFSVLVNLSCRLKSDSCRRCCITTWRLSGIFLSIYFSSFLLTLSHSALLFEQCLHSQKVSHHLCE